MYELKLEFDNLTEEWFFVVLDDDVPRVKVISSGPEDLQAQTLADRIGKMIDAESGQ